MNFDSLDYLIFLPIVVLLHWLCPTRFRWVILLGASCFFYLSWSVPLGLLLLSVIAVTWLTGLALERANRPGLRKAVLFFSLLTCLGVLFYFKYFSFLAESLAALLGAHWSLREIVLPVGLSFYIFQAMSYVVDVYRGSLAAERHPGYYALYISFFPQLVAGPIERAGDLLPQLRSDRSLSRQDMELGIRYLLSGFFRKVVIADLCGQLVTRVYDAPSPDGSAVLLGTLLFGVQIYCDFAGYSEIARGSARLLGTCLMENFDRPYLARSLPEFWRRWHISLGNWFTDYVYIPLGGSRHGMKRQILATMVVFALSGLWHGANWTFWAWGLYHGCLMVLTLLLSRRASPLPAWAGRALTFTLVTLGWVLFRSQSLLQAASLLGRLFSPWDLSAGLSCLGMEPMEGAWLLLSLLLLPYLHRLTAEEARYPGDMAGVYTLLAITLGWVIRLEQSGAGQFIYFQF